MRRISYEEFIAEVKSAGRIGVYGIYSIEYTKDIGNILNSLELLLSRGKNAHINADWYYLREIDEWGISLESFNDYYYVLADGTNFEYFQRGRIFIVATPIEMTILKIA